MTIKTIILEAKKGKQSAQNALIELLWAKVFYYVVSKIKNEAEAEDITVETFTKVLSKLKLYNEDFDFSTWVISIAHNTMIDHIRKSPELNIPLDEYTAKIQSFDSHPSPEDYLISKQDNDELIAAIQKLNPTYQAVIELRYLEEKTYKEIALELNLSLANVKVRILRAKQLLMDILQNNN